MIPIQIADAGAYLGWRGAVEEGALADTHLADFVFPNSDGRPQRAAVKMYPASSTGILNEIIGYSLAKALLIPQPEFAALFMMQTSHLTEKPVWMSQGCTEWVAFCTSWIPKKTCKPWFNNMKGMVENPPDKKTKKALGKISLELNQWLHATRTCAFDHWTGNADRNIGNIIRMGKGSFSVIDHGQLLGGEPWTANGVAHGHVWDNKLKRLVEQKWNDKAKGSLDSFLYKDSLGFIDGTPPFAMIEKILAFLEPDLPKHRQQYLQAFLHHRAKVDYLKAHYRMLA